MKGGDLLAELIWLHSERLRSEQMGKQLVKLQQEMRALAVLREEVRTLAVMVSRKLH
jgi:hypothetical protein